MSEPIRAGQAIVKFDGRKFRDWFTNRAASTRYVVSDEPHIRYVEITLEEFKDGFLPHIEVKNTGRWNKRHLRVSGASRTLEVEASAAGVKSLLRRVREREAVEIEQADERIARLEAELKIAREERQEALARAWTNGHAYTLAEAKAVADEHLAAVEARRAVTS